MAEIEGIICNNFRQAKDKRLQIEIDADVYCMSEDEIINILIKHECDAEKYRKKPKKRKYMPRPKKYDEKRIKELYNEGKGDLEVSQIIGCTRQIVYYWRLRNELPSNGRKKRSPNKNAAQLQL